MITVNGETFDGQNIIIRNGRVIVDGKDVTPEVREINIVINGNIDTLVADACQKISVTGDVGNLKTVSGNVDIKGSALGPVTTTSGDIICGEVKNSISSVSGNIDCDDVKGSISSISGIVRHK